MNIIGPTIYYTLIGAILCIGAFFIAVDSPILFLKERWKELKKDYKK